MAAGFPGEIKLKISGIRSIVKKQTKKTHIRPNTQSWILDGCPRQ
jgi:hypothetical protein